MLQNSTVFIIIIVVAAKVASSSNECSLASNCQDLICNNVIPVLNNASRDIRDKHDNSVEQLFRRIELLESTTDKRLAAMEAIMARLEAVHNATQAKKEALKSRNKFITDSHYENLKMVIDSKESIPAQLIPKDLTLQEATNECARICDNNSNCHAFNIYETDAGFECEPLTENLCLRRTRLAFVTHSGSAIWERKSQSSQESCLGAMLTKDPNRSLCDILKPGCYGKWPSCICAKTCKDCTRFFSRRDWEQSSVHCTLWPEGETHTITPIFGRCMGPNTVLSMRTVNLTSGTDENFYLMSFRDMARIARLNAYTFVTFTFRDHQYDWYEYLYDNWSIDETGTLSNLTFNTAIRGGRGDLLKLNRQAMKPTPFVTVTDDRYGCGSFWLLDPQNATYCPGGQISMFGKVEYDGTKVRKTGISIPIRGRSDSLVYYGTIVLRDNVY